MRLQFSVWLWAFLACALAVLVLALMPSPPRMISTGWDKSNHMLAFGVLTALGLKAFAQRLRTVLLCTLAYGVLIEILQSFTPNRSAEWGDLVADAVGIALGFGLIQISVRIGNSNARLHRSIESSVIHDITTT